MDLYKLIKIENLSGSACTIYSITSAENELKTSLDQFIEENINSFKSETKQLISRLHTIGHKTGARIQYFKTEEGKPGDGVCALYDTEESNLRLYCIRYDKHLIIVGGGGFKPKNIRALQEDDKLKKENYFLRELSAIITTRIKEKDIRYSDDGMEFIGDMDFNKDDF